MTISKGQLLRIKELAAAVTCAKIRLRNCKESLKIQRDLHIDMQKCEDQFNRYLRKLMHPAKEEG